MVTKAPNPTDKYVGSRVRMRRIMLGMSQEKLGEALGLTFQQVQKYEKGTNRIGASRIQKISDILQVPVSFLFEGGPGSATGAQGFSEAPSTAYVSDFLATSEGLTRVDLKHVTIALQSQMVGSQPFDALPVPGPAIASDSVQTTEADGVVAEKQALRDRSIGDLGRTERAEADVPSGALAIPVSTIVPR